MTARDLSTGLRWTRCNSPSSLDRRVMYMQDGAGESREVDRGFLSDRLEKGTWRAC